MPHRIWLTLILATLIGMAPIVLQAQTLKPNYPDRIGLNFIRPDVNRPGNYDFMNSGLWLVSQYKKIGVRWNRLAFSWVLVQPRRGEYDWSHYDRLVEACRSEGIEILATLGGHFDSPPVPAWAGESLAEIIQKNPSDLENFVKAWVQRYRGKIHFWEILNEPKVFHKDLTVSDYVEKILKPCYRIIKKEDPSSRVLPCAFGELPVLGDKEEFWDAARGYYDFHNMHLYVDWGLFRSQPSAVQEEQAVRDYLALMKKHGEGGKTLWITEIGWWGTASLTGSIFEYYKKDNRNWGTKYFEFLDAYTGSEMLSHAVVLREDALRAEWMKDLAARVLPIPGCEKFFFCGFPWMNLKEDTSPISSMAASLLLPRPSRLTFGGSLPGTKPGARVPTPCRNCCDPIDNRERDLIIRRIESMSSLLNRRKFLGAGLLAGTAAAGISGPGEKFFAQTTGTAGSKAKAAKGHLVPYLNV